jgi:hypothetical protein
MAEGILGEQTDGEKTRNARHVVRNIPLTNTSLLLLITSRPRTTMIGLQESLLGLLA